MESKKDIGKLFKDHLEQLDFSPSTKVWEQIELDLKKKKKKRRFIIWFFFGALLLGSLLGGMVYTLSDAQSIMENKIEENSISNEIDTNNSISRSPKNSDTNDLSESVTEITTSEKSSTKNQTITNTLLKSNATNSKNKQTKTTKIKSQESVSNTISSFKKKLSANKRSSYAIAKSISKKQRKATKTNSETTKISPIETLSTSKNETDLTKSNSNETIAKQTLIDSLIAETNNTKKTSKKDMKEKDSLPINDSVTDKKQKTKEYEIVVAPYYGINYGNYFGNFNSLSNNSVLEEKSEVSSAYGVLVRWMFGSKFGIQTGVGKINSRYISTVEKIGNTFINTQNVATDIPISELNAVFANETKVKLTYENSFIEVPLEAYYVVRDKKFGVATTFGISMLFGNKNTVFAESENVQRMKIGTLTTNSPTSATVNGKVNLFYKITPSLQFDLYPTFQYQIMGNTDSSNYSSYFFSVRTGLSYKF